MEVSFAPQFRRQFKKLPRQLQEETLEKIALFKDTQQHKKLRVHILQGKLAKRWSFSVNYRFRIVFMWERRNASAIFLAIGDHTVYD